VCFVAKEGTKKMLLEHDVQLEDFGGDVQSVCISALKVFHPAHCHQLHHKFIDRNNYPLPLAIDCSISITV